MPSHGPASRLRFSGLCDALFRTNGITLNAQGWCGSRAISRCDCRKARFPFNWAFFVRVCTYVCTCARTYRYIRRGRVPKCVPDHSVTQDESAPALVRAKGHASLDSKNCPCGCGCTRLACCVDVAGELAAHASLMHVVGSVLKFEVLRNRNVHVGCARRHVSQHEQLHRARMRTVVFY